MSKRFAISFKAVVLCLSFFTWVESSSGDSVALGPEDSTAISTSGVADDQSLKKAVSASQELFSLLRELDLEACRFYAPGAFDEAQNRLDLARESFLAGDYVSAGDEFDAARQKFAVCPGALPTFPIEMVFVPAGEFRMGTDLGLSHEKPIQNMRTRAYWIGKYEITNKLYLKFCRQARHRLPKDPKIGNRQMYLTSFPDYPVLNVSFFDAVAFCRWLSKETKHFFRLPTEAEWEKAARGTDGRKYTWGNEWGEAKANIEGVGRIRNGPVPVDSLPEGVSPYGCYHMLGNVEEWCADFWTVHYVPPSEYTPHMRANLSRHRTSRGGSYSLSRSSTKTYARTKRDPDEQKDDLGFRVVITPSRPKPPN